MAFDLQKVLRALLFSTNQPLSIKDVQDIFTRFHNQAPPAPAAAPAAAALAPALTDQPDLSAQANLPAQDPAPAPAADSSETEIIAEDSADADLYQDVPSLVPAAQIREALDAISAELAAADDIYILVEGPNGYRLMTHPRYARWIRVMRNEPPPVKLSQSALETLAVVAYRQPVTRSEIESIRGVSAEAGLNKLLERELIHITGRADLPGRPLQYSTTEKFLEFIGVKTLVELPASDVLSPRKIDELLQNTANIKPPTDADMGLSIEVGENAPPNFASVALGQSTPPFAFAAAPESAPAGSAGIPLGENAATNPATPEIATDTPAPEVVMPATTEDAELETRN